MTSGFLLLGVKYITLMHFVTCGCCAARAAGVGLAFAQQSAAAAVERSVPLCAAGAQERAEALPRQLSAETTRKTFCGIKIHLVCIRCPLHRLCMTRSGSLCAVVAEAQPTGAGRVTPLAPASAGAVSWQWMKSETNHQQLSQAFCLNPDPGIFV